jgi:peptidoglycan/LPS O-acetylase OafA/YrhL
MYIEDRARSRDNHFNLIRFTAALMVLLSHSPIFLGAPIPWRDFLHTYDLDIGGMSVNVFFVVSGFLVTASLFNRNSLAAFAWARFLRIFPGLWVMLVLVVFGLGPVMTTAPLAEYFTSPLTRDYFLHCATIVNGIRHFLPGMFEHNPFNAAVNGSLWTLPLEWRMYEFLALGWAVLALLPKYRSPAFRIFVPAVVVVTFCINASQLILHQKMDLGMINTFMFFSGAAIFLFASRIPLAFKALPLLVAGVIFSLTEFDRYFVLYLLLTPITVILLAYAPGRLLLNFNRLGDYSYGVYIYAAPIQQTLVALNPGLSTLMLTIYASAASLVMAALSWRFVEKPALTHKEAFAAATMRWIGAALPRLGFKWPGAARPPAATSIRSES